MKRLLVIFLVILLGQNVSGQTAHYQHFSLWTRFQVSKKLPKNWDIMSLIYWRRQNDLHYGQLNLQQPLMIAAQTTVGYTLKSHPKLNLVLGQFTMNYTKAYLGKETDFDLPNNQEFRYAGGFIYTFLKNKQWNINTRFLQEMRFQKSNDYNVIGRFRTKWFMSYKAKPFVATNFFVEGIFYDPPNLTNVTPVRFHQLWVSPSLMWQVSKHLKIETGYTYLFARRPTKVEFDDMNIANLHFFWEY